MKCTICGETIIGPLHLERGRCVCWLCYKSAKRRSRLGRVGYWLRILRAPRMIDNAQLPD